jgi:predicted DNA-binding WGR domain protein
MKRRFELVEDGSSKFWEVTSEGRTFQVSWGKIGTAGQSQIKSFDDEAKAAIALAKLVKEKVGKGYVEQSPSAAESPNDPSEAQDSSNGELAATGTTAAPEDETAVRSPSAPKAAKVKKAKEPAVDELAFEEMSGKKVQSIVAKLSALTEAYQADKLMKKAGLESPAASRFAWHVAAKGLLCPIHDPLLALLVPPYGAIEAEAEHVFSVLRAIPESPSVGHTHLLTGWSVLEARIASQAVALDPERAAAILPELAPRVRLGVQLARGLAGASLPEGDRRAITARMAEVDVRGKLVASSNGKVTLHGSPWDESTGIAVPLGVLAAIGVDEATYVEALATAIRARGVGSVARAMPGLRILSLPELVEALRRHEDGASPLLSYSHVPPEIARLLVERADPPEALRAAASSLGTSREDATLSGLLLARANG